MEPKIGVDFLILPQKGMLRFGLLVIMGWVLVGKAGAVAKSSRVVLPRSHDLSLPALSGFDGRPVNYSGFKLDCPEWNNLPTVEFVGNRRQMLMDAFYAKPVLKAVSTYNRPLAWTPTRKVMVHALAVKYKRPDYGRIEYKPTYVSRNFLPNTGLDRFNARSGKGASAYDPSSASTVYQLADKLPIASPMMARHRWDDIPSPHRFVLDGVMLDKKAAEEAFKITTIQTSKKLEKPKVIDSKWKVAGTEAMQFSQAHFENWVKGGQNSISLLSDLLVTAKYKQGKLEWDNKGIHKLGILSSEGERSRINNDVFQVNSKVGVNASKRWFYSALFDFKTQFFNGRDKKNWSQVLSKFMSPAYITFALGMDYKRDDFTLMISPVTSKTTVVLDTVKVDKGRYNISDGKKSNSQTGASLYNNFKWKLSPEFTLTSNMDLFYGYMNDVPETQLEWELYLDMRINKYLSTRISTTYRYFESESNKLQLKENFSVVFSYKF